jgi:signal transduction histidine kinase/ActR/RegA family two-component response regulator/HPt (histidine-containing phosphotransfer) domain-containing protein
MSGPDNKHLKKNSIQLKIGFLMILAVILLTATCYLLYRNLSSIVSSIRIDETPELRLLSIREISTDIEKAGNSVRIYTITKNPKDIKPYYTFISSIDEKVNRLGLECNNDSVLLVQTDTISNLIEENIRIWNKLLVLSRDNNVIGNLRQLSVHLDSVSGTFRKQGILKRVFSLSADTSHIEKDIAADLENIVEQNRETRDELAVRELQLAKNSSVITGKFYDLITKMENEVYERIQAKAEAAGVVADKTYRWLVMLSVSGGLLAILVIYIIIRYARNAYAYQIALENAKDEAEKLAKTKELFMANMSHEIRTPVTAISGFTEQLLHESLNNDTNSSLKVIKSSSDHLLKIIDDILDFSKLQSNKLALEKVHFSISQILSEVRSMFERQAQQNNTTLSYWLDPKTPEVLLGDPYRLKQIMINLISNSVKFTINGIVHLEVTSIRKPAEEIDLLMEFSDTGIGIDESKLNAIFEDFTQAEMSTTRKYGGTGLGLSIVKKLVELQGGTIDLKSKKNKGTTIVCRIPFSKGDEKLVKKDISPPVRVPEEISGLKILVVDDEEYNRMLFKKILDRWKIKCRLTGSGMEALDVLKEEKYDLLFMDMRMPGIDGLKTTRFIREEMGISESDMPVIFISAASMSEDLQKFKNGGINAFLQKPFTEEMLLSSILTVTGNKIQPYFGEAVVTDNKPDGEGKLDLHNLYHISGSDEQFVKQMLISFITTTGKGLNELREAVTKQQWESASDISHKIQPPCRHIGAMDLYNLLNKIERTIRINGNTGSVEALAENALVEFGIVSRLLDDHIAKIS